MTPASSDIATCMYHTGIDPFTRKPIRTAKNLRDCKLQRALMQFIKPENYFEVREALFQMDRDALVGGCDGLIPAQPPNEAIDARRKQANLAPRNDHSHSVANPAAGEEASERPVPPQVGHAGYRPPAQHIDAAGEAGVGRVYWQEGGHGMSTAAKLNVEIDEAIRADAELLHDVEAATAYLDEQHEWTRPPAVVRWTLAWSQLERTDHGPAVTLTLTDWPEYGASVAVSEPLSRVRTRGQAYRERAVMRVWTELLQKRSRTILKRVGKALDQIDDDPERTDGE